MNGHIYAAVVGAAMELGLFWLLADKPLPAAEIARTLGVPLNCCWYWLQILCHLGLLEDSGEGYSSSTLARQTILDLQDQDTWAFQAREDRHLSLYVRDLATNIRLPMPAWQPQAMAPSENFHQLEQDPLYMAQFTRKLYQIHRALAGQLAKMLDLHSLGRMLDLGGGSGVVSFALLRKYDSLASVVVDAESVCQEGRKIAAENHLHQRITYLAADIVNDELPAGFDLALLCDVGSFSQGLFRKIHALLNPNGRLAIVDKFASTSTSAPPSRLLAAFLSSLESPADTVDYITAEVVQSRLLQAGFRDISAVPVPHEDDLPWNIDWTLLLARK
jgi:SAM-dependent methyltransferase